MVTDARRSSANGEGVLVGADACKSIDKNVKRQGTIKTRKIIKLCDDFGAKYH